MPLPYDPTNPVYDTGSNQGRSTPPGYNDPYYDPQRQAQLDGQQSFQPTPASPPPTTYQNWQDVFGSQPYSGNSTTMPTYNPDVFGSGGNLPNGGFSNFNSSPTFTPQGTSSGTYTPTTFGSISALPAPAGSTQPQQQAVNPDSAFPKYDPAYLSQIQAATEDPNGAYANRKPGDYGPIGAPDYVLNPQNDQQWKERFYWMAANPTAFTTGYTQPRDLSAQQYDYSKPNSVPYTAFQNNLYADTNAKQGFHELSGVLAPDQLRQVQQQFGWQDAVQGFNADGNQVYRAADALARQNPGVDYEVIKVAQPDGSIAYGLQKREQSIQAQQARGFGLPAPAPVQHASGGGGGSSRYTAQAKSVGSLPAPKGLQFPPANFNIDKYQIPADKNPYNLLTQPGKIGETVSYGGQVYTYNGVTWVPQSATVVPPNGGGGGSRPPQYQSR